MKGFFKKPTFFWDVFLGIAVIKAFPLEQNHSQIDVSPGFRSIALSSSFANLSFFLQIPYCLACVSFVTYDIMTIVFFHSSFISSLANHTEDMFRAEFSYFLEWYCIPSSVITTISIHTLDHCHGSNTRHFTTNM